MPAIFHIGGYALIVCDRNNLDRISARDPMILDLGKIGRDDGRPVQNIIVTFGDEDDVAELYRLMAGEFTSALKFACRGMTSQPDDRVGLVRIASSDPKGPVPS